MVINKTKKITVGIIAFFILSAFNINDIFANTLIDSRAVVVPEQTLNNLNTEIISENSLETSLSTNQISFTSYNGTEDLTNNELNITVTSGLYYDLFVTLDSEIRGTNDTNAVIDKANFKIKTSDDLEYKSIVNVGERVNLVSNHVNGRDFVHNINLKLLQDSSVKADTYKTTITFEVVQK